MTVENFPRAASDLYFASIAIKEGGFGKFVRHTISTPMDKQDVVRTNRDTLYSAAVFDLDAGPVNVTLPDAETRFMSMQVLDEDQYTTSVAYGNRSYTLTKEKIGTRYVLACVRMLVNPDEPKDVEEVHALQDSIKVNQKSRGIFDVPKWDQASLKKVREALLLLGSTLPDMEHAFGSKGQVDPVRYLIGSAATWGRNPDKDAIYLNVTPKQNDGLTVYQLHVEKNVPVDGFWSISLYDAKGYNAYSLNSVTGRKDASGSVTVQFGGCNGEVPNCLPITPGWNYMVRLYRPRPEALSGKWTFPDPQPMFRYYAK